MISHIYVVGDCSHRILSQLLRERKFNPCEKVRIRVSDRPASVYYAPNNLILGEAVGEALRLNAEKAETKVMLVAPKDEVCLFKEYAGDTHPCFDRDQVLYNSWQFDSFPIRVEEPERMSIGKLIKAMMEGKGIKSYVERKGPLQILRYYPGKHEKSVLLSATEPPEYLYSLIEHEYPYMLPTDHDNERAFIQSISAEDCADLVNAYYNKAD